MHEDHPITLWTVHPPSFSLTEGCVDHSKSEYYRNLPRVKDAYHELWRRLQILDGQVVWCFTHEGDIAKTGIEKVKWELHVPSPKIIPFIDERVWFIDELVWNRILGRKASVRDDMRHQWCKEALKKFPNDPEASAVYEKRCFENFWSQEPKSGNWWNELFTKNAGNCVSALISHPIPNEWIHESTTWRCR